MSSPPAAAGRKTTGRTASWQSTDFVIVVTDPADAQFKDRVASELAGLFPERCAATAHHMTSSWQCYLFSRGGAVQPELTERVSLFGENSVPVSSFCLKGEFITESKLQGTELLDDIAVKYAKSGSETLNELNGWFAGVIVDSESRRVSVFNDRYGLGRLYCYRNANTTILATTVRAIQLLVPETRSFCDQALADYLSCGCTLSNTTLFPHISILPPASVWEWSSGVEPAKSRFHSFESCADSPLSLDAYNEAVVETFKDILPRYLNDVESVALSLTGGLDTRMILAWADSSLSALPCFTFTGMNRESRDASVARRVAATAGCDFSEIMVDERFLSRFEELAREAVLRAEGTVDVTGAVELFINQEAGKECKIGRAHV